MYWRAPVGSPEDRSMRLPDSLPLAPLDVHGRIIGRIIGRLMPVALRHFHEPESRGPFVLMTWPNSKYSC